MKNGDGKSLVKKSFETLYKDLCCLYNIYPFNPLTSHLKDGVVDINGDKLTLEDWQPILESLKFAFTIKFVAIRSNYDNFSHKYVSELPISQQISKSKTVPALWKSILTCGLCSCLKDLLTKSLALTTLELQGIPFKLQDLRILRKGLSKNHSLNHLSFENCCIGDNGFKVLASSLKNILSITSLNLINNCLTSKGAELIAKLIKYQSILHLDEAWQNSLRYQNPNVYQMSGLRRITLNDNSDIGDNGALFLVDALKDDYWIKALDLQNCGITDKVAKVFLDLVCFNTEILVLDLRDNPQIEESLIFKIINQVLKNGSGSTEEYKWIKLDLDKRNKVESEKSTSLTKLKTQKLNIPKLTKRSYSTLNIFQSKLSFQRPFRSTFHRRCYSAGTIRKPERISRKALESNFVPWRVTSRLQSYRGYPEKHSPGKLSLEEKFEQLKIPVKYQSSPQDYHSHLHLQPDDKVDQKELNKNKVLLSDYESSIKGLCNASKYYKREREHYSSLGNDPKGDTNIYQTNFKRQVETLVHDDELIRNIEELKTELLGCRHRLETEVVARQAAENQIMKLTLENNHLRQQLGEIFHEHSRKIAEDDHLLDSVEKSFQKFHSFLDLLHDVGFGPLVKASGLHSTLFDVQQVSTKIGQNLQQNAIPFQDSIHAKFHEIQSSVFKTQSSKSKFHSSKFDLHKEQPKEGDNFQLIDNLTEEQKINDRQKEKIGLIPQNIIKIIESSSSDDDISSNKQAKSKSSKTILKSDTIKNISKRETKKLAPSSLCNIAMSDSSEYSTKSMSSLSKASKMHPSKIPLPKRSKYSENKKHILKKLNKKLIKEFREGVSENTSFAENNTNTATTKDESKVSDTTDNTCTLSNVLNSENAFTTDDDF